MTIRRLFVLLSCLLLAASATASSIQTATPTPALLLAADGILVIEPDGTVQEREVATKVSAELRQALLASLGKLRYEPVLVGGKAVRARVAFHVLLSGEQLADGRMRASIDSIDFRTPKGETAVQVDGVDGDFAGKRMAPPIYPRNEDREGMMGEVRLAIRATPDGRTADVMVVYSMLFNADASSARARRALHAFELAALAAARRWTYVVPADAATRTPAQLTATTTVAYMFDLERVSEVQPGVWIPVLRTPRSQIAWLPREDSRRLAETASASGAFAGANAPFKLRDPVGGIPVL